MNLNCIGVGGYLIDEWMILLDSLFCVSIWLWMLLHCVSIWHCLQGWWCQRWESAMLWLALKHLKNFLSQGCFLKSFVKLLASWNLDSLFQLFIDLSFYILYSSLLPDRKLKTLLQRPVNKIPETKDGYSLLLFWYWEECVKQRCVALLIFCAKVTVLGFLFNI